MGKGIGVQANIHLGVKPSFVQIVNTNCLSRGPAREKNIIMNYMYYSSYF